MSYLQARSGIARSGVTFAGWTPPNITVTLGGTDRSTYVLLPEWSLTTRADGTPAVFKFRVYGIDPVVGQDVKVTYATPDDYLFGGTLLQREAVIIERTTPSVIWDCTAVGYQWLLDRYDRVTAQYATVGVSTIVGDILATYTNGGFRVGYCPSSLGTLTMEFTFETVWDALQRIAKAKGATVEIVPDLVVNLYTTYPEAALPTVTARSFIGHTFTYREDLTQARTRVRYEGTGTTLTAGATAGTATLSVADLASFPSSGSAVVGRSIISYTGRSVASGPGDLTGVSGLLYDVGANEGINLLVTVTDPTAQTALAALLGGGLSGQATQYLQNGNLSNSEMTARASADLATFGGSLIDIAFTYWPAQRNVRAGRTVTLSVAAPSPVSVSGDYPIQAVTITPVSQLSGPSGADGIYQTVQLGTFTRNLTELLKQLQG